LTSGSVLRGWFWAGFGLVLGWVSLMENVAFFFHIVGVMLFVAGIVLAGAAFEAARRRERPSEIALLLGLTRVGVVLVAPQRPPRPSVGWLAYVHEGDIYLADTAGNGSRRITHADGLTFVNVAWSPDGTRLAAEADSGTILIDPLTAAAAFVGGTGSAWSPDGKQLAVVDFVPGGSRL